MSAQAAKAAARVTQAASKVATQANQVGSRPSQSQSPVKKGARRDPELYILAVIMTGAFGMAGYFFGSKPTSSTSETTVSMAEKSMPWETEGSGKGYFKYQYHPGGDKSKPLKDAPGALNSVIIPALTLPKRVHDKVNKYGRDDF